MNVLSCADFGLNTGADPFLLWGIILAIVLIFILIVRHFVPQEQYEAADPEKFAENILEYRDACLNKMVTYILLQYGVPLDKMENTAKSYQTDLECVMIDIPVADLDMWLYANYNTKKYILNATQVMPDGTIKVFTDVADMKDDVMCDYIWLQKFIYEVQDGIADWEHKTYAEVFKDLAEIASAPEFANLSEQERETIFYSSILEFADLFQKRKYRKSEVINPYMRLLAYLFASGKREDFIKFVNGQVDSITKPSKEPITVEEKEEV